MLKGNKGEWSEFYAFLKILSEREIVAADENLQKLQDIFYPVLKIIREETGKKTDYELLGEGGVRIVRNGSEIALVSSTDLKDSIRGIFNAIKRKSETTFTISEADVFAERFAVSKLSAGNARKEDIVLKIHDRMTGAEPEVGFSIKSMLGGAATLLNASSATNFIFKVDGVNNENAERINNIDTRSKIRDRVLEINKAGGHISFYGTESSVFERNLRKVETVLPEILAELILGYFSEKGVSTKELISALALSHPEIRGFSNSESDYEFKIKRFLYDVALGMVPSRTWDGLHGVHGGYIIVKEDGEVVCYHVFNADQFRDYLFLNTRFDTPSSTRHGFGVIYLENGEFFIKLNTQIRFIR